MTPFRTQQSSITVAPMVVILAVILLQAVAPTVAQQRGTTDARSREQRELDREREREALLTQKEREVRAEKRIQSAWENREGAKRGGEEWRYERIAERFGLKGRAYERVRDAAARNKLLVFGETMDRVIPTALELGGTSYAGREPTIKVSTDVVEYLARERVRSWRLVDYKDGRLEDREAVARARVVVSRELELPYLNVDQLMDPSGRPGKQAQSNLDRHDNRQYFRKLMDQNYLFLDINEDPLKTERSYAYKVEHDELRARGYPNYIRLDRTFSDRIGRNQ